MPRLTNENVDARDVGITPIQLVDDLIVVLDVTAQPGRRDPGRRIFRRPLSDDWRVYGGYVERR